jgi:Zn-dependent protease
MTFSIVLFGWIFSLCLHEFSHALVAYYGGDYTVREKGYLTFNPIRYTDPIFSIVLPIVFLLMGGIGLPGGAVYIERWRIRNRYWLSAMSLAGPTANLLVAIVLGLVLRFVPSLPPAILPGLSFLLALQISAVFFNLIPLPPFDGYGVIEPFLHPDISMQMNQYRSITLAVIFILFWFVPLVSRIFWTGVFIISAILGAYPGLIIDGLERFQFWNL